MEMCCIIPYMLEDMRAKGARMNIRPQQIWMHEQTLIGGPEAGKVWYNSIDVVHTIPQTIPHLL